MRRPNVFTLTEVLAVIAIIVLLMSILLRTLQRVGKQARAVTCRWNLHEWGLFLSIRVNDSDGMFPDTGIWPYSR